MIPAYIADHAARGLARLAEQYKNKPKFAALINSLNRQIQELENAFYQLLTERSIDTAIGVQLDILGKIVGERRGGALDADYRLRIRARIRANLSSGTVEDIYAVFRALLGMATPPAVFKWADAFPAGFVFTIVSPVIMAAQVPIFVRFLRDSKGGGIGAHFGWQPVPDALAFTLAISAFLSAPAMMGDTSITVAPITLANFPATGSLIIDEGETTEETVAYTARTSTTFTVAALAFAHAVDSACKLTPSPGLGLGEDANPATGGAFVGIVDVDV